MGVLLFCKNKEFWRPSASSQPLSQNRLSPSAVGQLRGEEQVPITTTTVHCWQYCINRDSGTPIPEMTEQPENQRVVSKACSFLSQINKAPKWEKYYSIHKNCYPPFRFCSPSEWRWKGTTSFSYKHSSSLPVCWVFVVADSLFWLFCFGAPKLTLLWWRPYQ